MLIYFYPALEMFTDQIPTMPRYCNKSWPVGKPHIANPTPLVPCDDDLTEGWGLSFSISHTKSVTGRAAGSGSWEGVANIYWFADRETGIGAIIASQILPYGGQSTLPFLVMTESLPRNITDLKLIECSEQVEKITYDEVTR